MHGALENKVLWYLFLMQCLSHISFLGRLFWVFLVCFGLVFLAGFGS